MKTRPNIPANAKRSSFSTLCAFILTLSILAVSGCDKTVAVTGVKLDKTSLSLVEGETANLTATIQPETATNGAVTWTSSDTGVATVSGGTVKAMKAGSATITVMTADGGKSATCAVTVDPKVIEVTGITLNQTTLNLNEGGNYTLKATVTPSDATDPTVTWSSDNPSAAIVSDGVVAALKAGDATITAKAGEKTASCRVTVVSEAVHVESVSLDRTTLTVEINKSAKLTATIKPSDATNVKMNWSSGNTGVATVDDEGNVKGLAKGNATITVSTEEGGKTASCSVTVVDNTVTSVTFTDGSSEAIKVKPGVLYTLAAVVLPEDASNKSLEWSCSSASGKSSVSAGKVTFGRANETVTVTATSAATPSVSASQRFDVEIPATKVTLDATSLQIATGQTAKLTASIYPEDAKDRTVSWSSSNAEVATVGSDGTISAKKAGTAEITAASNSDESLKAVCQISVIEGGCSVKINDGDAVDYKVGNLKSVLDGKTVTKLEWVKGAMNGTDIDALRTYTKETLKSVDLSKISLIADGTSFNFSGLARTITNPLAMPLYMFIKFTYLETAVIPENIIEIGESCFQSCANFSSIKLPDGLETIGYQAFYGCAFKNIDFPDNLKTIGQSAFLYCHLLEEVTIPDNIKIGSDAFYGCSNLKRVTIGSGCSITINPFIRCNNLTSFAITGTGGNLSARDNLLLSGDGTTLLCYPGGLATETLTVPGWIKTIGNQAASNVYAKTIVVEEGVEEVKDYGLYGINYATEMTLPSTLKKFYGNAFLANAGLTKITVNAATPPVKSGYETYGPFDDSAKAAIFVPAGSVEAYKAADGWKLQADQIKAIE